jgi:hypothetical protein
MTPPAHVHRWARLLGALAVLCAAGTYVAAQIDFVRRHHPGIAPRRYWWPQLTQIWVPGLALALGLGAVAWFLARRHRS